MTIVKRNTNKKIVLKATFGNEELQALLFKSIEHPNWGNAKVDILILEPFPRHKIVILLYLCGMKRPQAILFILNALRFL
jgi:hypothetical protein